MCSSDCNNLANISFTRPRVSPIFLTRLHETTRPGSFFSMYLYTISTFINFINFVVTSVSKKKTWTNHNSTGKSLSEALLFAEHGENMLCTKIVPNVRNNFCTQHCLPRFKLGIFMYQTCNSMNNLSSYCGLLVSWCEYNRFWQRFTCTYYVYTIWTLFSPLFANFQTCLK